ncbi:DUF2911 domain-containing protein [Desertivirga arenae]|uniref:DUF2911 domain-containing protein n=1 Tax=Desertivirga arenae TaxID=2810309 RepID=UPI001A97D028|nr:DUF2911 domain-containing protein [Pedobacter sp. SYSU D00823]
MKKTLFAAIAFTIVTAFSASAQQDKSKRVSPPVTVTETTKKGAKITITYGQPSLKGRKIGTDFVPYGKVWRTGANEATVFEIDKDVKIKGQTLPAGKYGLYTIPGEKEWVVIFNKTWDQWGTKYSEADDQLRVTVKPEHSEKFQEKLVFEISKAGEVSIEWGDTEVEFEAK